MAKKPTLTGGTKRYKSQKKKETPNKAASRIEDLHEHWLVDNAAAEERTPTAVTLTRKLHLGGHPRILRGTSRKL
jgi:hypothetical protein